MLGEIASTSAAPAGEGWAEPLLLRAPARLFTGVIGPASPGIPPPGFLALLTAAGYWRGAWLRRAVRGAAGGHAEAALPIEPKVPTSADFDEAHARATDALDDAAAEDDTALASAEAELHDLAERFGEELGELLEVVELPPEGAADREDFATERGPLDVALATPKLAVQSDLARWIDDLASPPDDRWQAVAEVVAERQDEGLARGRQVFDLGISLQGLPEEAYALLLDLWVLGVEVLQVAACAAAAAAAAGDADAARRSALARAGLVPWLAGQEIGLRDPSLDGAGADAWPSLG